MWNLKQNKTENKNQGNKQQNRNRLIDTENEVVVARGECVGMNELGEGY